MRFWKLLLLWILVTGFYLVLILVFNQGNFVYTLDDAYIHLAMAEQMAHGGYGINAGEMASASSSILWPVLLILMQSWLLAPFVLNALAGGVTLWGCSKIFAFSLGDLEAKRRNFWMWGLVSGCIPMFNLIGLVFTGMEHTLQLMLVVFILYGLLISSQGGGVPRWLYTCLICAPLVRYECLAVVVPSLMLLLWWKKWREVCLVSLLIAALLGGYSYFLVRLGLDPLPSSILIKSKIAEGSLYGILANVSHNLLDRRGVILSTVTLCIFVWGCLTNTGRKMRELAFTVCMMSGLHLMFGRFGWYNRYEIYIWAVVMLFGWVILSPALIAWQKRNDSPRHAWALASLGVLCSLFLMPQYWANLLTVPIASRNIYRQQVQMARFAKEVVKGPVAVNDLGLVSWQNPNTVLDLWGLGSQDARKSRLLGSEGWMLSLTSQYDVKAVMIYKNWFPALPSSWIALGTLHQPGYLPVLGGAEVSFYATDEASYQELNSQLPAFIAQLPPGATFVRAKRGILEGKSISILPAGSTPQRPGSF